MNIVKRLFALVVTMVMMCTLSAPGFTIAMEEDQPVFLKPLVARYYIRINNLTNVEEGRILSRNGANLRVRDDSFYAEVADMNGRSLFSILLKDEHIIFDEDKLQFGIIGCGMGLQGWLESYNNVFSIYTEKLPEGLILNIYVSMENVQREIVATFKAASITLDTAINRKRTDIPVTPDFDMNCCCLDDFDVVIGEKRARY